MLSIAFACGGSTSAPAPDVSGAGGGTSTGGPVSGSAVTSGSATTTGSATGAGGDYCQGGDWHRGDCCSNGHVVHDCCLMGGYDPAVSCGCPASGNCGGASGAGGAPDSGIWDGCGGTLPPFSHSLHGSGFDALEGDLVTACWRGPSGEGTCDGTVVSHGEFSVTVRNCFTFGWSLWFSPSGSSGNQGVWSCNLYSSPKPPETITPSDCCGNGIVPGASVPGACDAGFDAADAGDRPD